MKLLLIEFNDTYFRDLAKQLLTDGTSIAYISTFAPKLYSEDKAFKNTTILDEANFHLSDKIKNLNSNNSASLSKEVLHEYLELESLYLSITDRLTFYPKSVIERKRRYQEILLYWKTFLENNKITTILFPRVPHLGYGNVVYYLAKKMNIKVLIIRETIYDDKSLITKGYNDYKKVPVKYLEKHTITSLKRQLKARNDSTFEEESALMQWNAINNADAHKINSASLVFSFLNKATFLGVIDLIHNPFSRYIGTPVYMEPPTTWLHYYWMIILYFYRDRKCLARYKSISASVDLKQKYIYLALHYQPERTSLPEGDVFENQLLMIDIICKSLPKGWYLYVKEHPYQYTRTDIRKMNFREPEYYDKMLQYKNLKLVSFEVSTNQLLKNCKASVTLTGSTGWETLLAHKPVITFSSSAWYSPCRSCYTVTSVDECKQALDEIIKTNSKHVQLNLYKFWIYISKRFVDSTSSVELAELSSTPYDMLIKKLSRAIIKLM